MACNRTAVSVLQELCAQRRWSPPTYEVPKSAGPSNDPTFEITVSLRNGVVARGLGRKKIEAKHDAAFKALLALQVSTGKNRSVPLPLRSLNPSAAHVNPHKSAGIVNAVGELQELCAIKHLPQPIYEEVGSQGDPHNRIFTCRVSVSKRQETGVGRSKKVAKQLAAQEMLTFLKSNLGDFLREISGDLAESSKVTDLMTDQQLKEFDDEVIEKYRHIKADGKFLPDADPGMPFDEYHVVYNNQLAGLGALMKSLRFVNERDPFVRLKMISSSLNRRITANFTLGKNKEHVVFMVVNTKPSVVQAGHSVRKEHAKELAAVNLIEFLKLMAS